MDLPPDKAKLLKNYDNEKKWDIICDQVSKMKSHYHIKVTMHSIAISNCTNFAVFFFFFNRKWFKQKIHHHII